MRLNLALGAGLVFCCKRQGLPLELTIYFFLRDFLSAGLP